MSQISSDGTGTEIFTPKVFSLYYSDTAFYLNNFVLFLVLSIIQHIDHSEFGDVFVLYVDNLI